MGAFYFLVGCVSIDLGLYEFRPDDPVVQAIIWGVIGLEFAVAALIGISICMRVVNGAFPLVLTDIAVVALAVVFPPTVLILLWWFLAVRKSAAMATEDREPEEL